MAGSTATKYLHASWHKPREIHLPAPGSEEEILNFKKLQENFAAQFESVFPNKLAPKTVVIVPSLTLDQEILSKVDGIMHYEERMLCLLMLLRMPRTHVIYMTSMPIDPVIIDYYLHLLPGITTYHARQRLTLLSCYDNSAKSLTEKILERPRLIDRIRNHIPFDHLAHLSCFNVTSLERSLAVQLQLPIYGCDPDLYLTGTKSNGRRIFQECGIPVAPGFEGLKTRDDIVRGLAELRRQMPHLRRAVIKMNDGFSGEGNASFSFDGISTAANPEKWVRQHFHRNLHIVARDLPMDHFLAKFDSMGGIVEAFIEGAGKKSPSVQCRINPLGKCDIISTHDQVLNGMLGQIYLGAHFPASSEYAGDLASMGLAVAENLRSRGVLGRFGIDFISVPQGKKWKHYAVEINLRKGGTTHPYLMLQFLTDGEYDEHMGLYFTANHQPRYYLTTDGLQSEHYKGLQPHDLIDIALCNDILYDGSSQEGVVFHLISALSQYGKLGILCIGTSPGSAEKYYARTLEVLDRESRK